jgi:hypothetical protein
MKQRMPLLFLSNIDFQDQVVNEKYSFKYSFSNEVSQGEP